MNRALRPPSVMPPGVRLAATGPLVEVRCLVVDDHPAIRVGLRELLATESGFEVIDAVASAEAAVAVAERARVDVAIVDYETARV
jgi:DNA-binding NarL/FixJ family response regulator